METVGSAVALWGLTARGSIYSPELWAEVTKRVTSKRPMPNVIRQLDHSQ